MVGLLLGCPQPSKIAGFNHEKLQDFWNIGFEASKLRNEEWILTWIDGSFIACYGISWVSWDITWDISPFRHFVQSEFGWSPTPPRGCLENTPSFRDFPATARMFNMLMSSLIYGKSPFFVGKSTISMVMFNGKLLNYPWRIHGAGIYANIYWGYIDGIHVTAPWIKYAFKKNHIQVDQCDTFQDPTTWIDIYRGIHIVWAIVYVFMIYQHDTSNFSISWTSDSNLYVTWWNVDQCWTNFQCLIGFFHYVHVLCTKGHSILKQPSLWIKNFDQLLESILTMNNIVWSHLPHAFPCNSSEFSICRFIRVYYIPVYCRTNPRLGDHYPSFSSRPNCISSYIVSKTYPMKYPIKAQFGPVKSQLLTCFMVDS